jgi:uncharacterized protein YqhQ
MARYNYGGQAVIEGVMMRGRHTAAVALRRSPDEVLVYEEQLNPHLYGRKISHWPFIRGLLLLFDMLILGTRMMRFAGDVYIQNQLNASQPGRPDTPPLPSPGEQMSKQTEIPAPAGSAATPEGRGQPTLLVEASPSQVLSASGAGLGLTLVVSLGIAIGLFFLLPLGLVSVLQRWLGVGWWSLALEGLFRLALLVGYLAAIGRLASVQRVFEYHGAEHKAINAYESGAPLDIGQVRRASRVHTRCGTGFLLIVVVLSIFVFALLGHPPVLYLVLSRILLVPVIAALAYELMRLGAANYRYTVVRWLMAPSLALQGLTTREPDDKQIECAIVALERVLKSDGVHIQERVA